MGKTWKLILKGYCDRVNSESYRPQAVRRAYVPKADGARRPIGIPVLEDKIVQGAVAEVLSAIYEVDFLGFSYGFRPGRSPHQALEALNAALIKRKVNWVLDADVRRFFDSVDHEWLLRMVAHRIRIVNSLLIIINEFQCSFNNGDNYLSLPFLLCAGSNTPVLYLGL
jgi:retron-type reverse transcriptase